MSAPVYVQYHQTNCGELIIGVFNNHLCLCEWRYRKMRTKIDQRITKFFNAEYVEQPHPLIDQSIHQLNEYLGSKRKFFDIPLILAGTTFQQKVWEALLQIPYGQTTSYLALATSTPINNPKAIRAVAAANGTNAISLFIPCHRVIGSNGKLVGYAGGLSTKQKLLEIEQSGFALNS